MVSERTPLLPDEPEDHPQEPRRIPVVFRLLPSLLFFSFGIGVSTLTIIDLVGKLLCTLWYELHDPSRIPPSGPTTEMCQAKGPAGYLSVYLAAEAIMNSLGGFVVASLIARFTSQFGRKPIFLILQVAQTAGICCFLALFFIGDSTFAYILLALWFTLYSFFNIYGLLLASNLMVLDSSTPSNRASYLSFTIGGVQLGAAPSYLVGGYIQERFGPHTLLLTSLSFSLIGLVYTLSPAVPETFKLEQQESAREERATRARLSRTHSLERWEAAASDRMRGPKRAVRKTFEGIVAIFDPVLRLKPVYNPDTGRMNYRLITIGVAFSLITFSTGYFGPAAIGYMMIHLKMDPTERGAALTLFSVSQIIGLTIIFPALNQGGRGLYDKFKKSRHGASNPEDHSNPATSEETSSHFEVYLLILSVVMLTIATFLAGFSNTSPRLMIAISITAAGVGAHPTIQSITAASVNPIVAGDVVAGVEMLGHITRTFAPIILGSIAAATAVTIPSLVFVVMGSVMVVAIGILFFIKDEDRYLASRSSE